MAAYGGRYNATPQTLNLVLGGTTQIPASSTMPPVGMTYIPNNSITVTDAGNYEINYSTTLSVAIGTTVTVAVRLNGTNIPGASVSRLLSVGTDSVVNGSIIVQLPAGAVIDLVISALIAVAVTLGSGVSASFTVKKLN